MIAALFVATAGCYFGIEGIDPWDVARDARLYDGTDPVVAHPPCKRWSMLAQLVQARYGYRIGDDGGCFASALASVRRVGGVLEHPANSRAWRAHGLEAPNTAGGWTRCDFLGGWTCHVEQGHYGHRARKPTWLYAVGVELPSMRWRTSIGVCEDALIAAGCGRKTEGRRWLRRSERDATPPEFRDLLINIARSARKAVAA